MKKVKLAFFIFFGYISIGCIASQLIPFINQDYSSFEKSIILGGGAFTSFFISFLLGRLTDKIKKIKPTFYICIGFYLLFICGIFLFQNIWIKGFCFVFMIGISRMLMSTIETMILIEKEDDFGKYHCMGAIGFICGSLLSSLLNDEYRVVLCVLSGFASILFILNYKEKGRENHLVCLKDIFLLLKNKEYMLLLFIFFFLMCMGFADQYVVVDKMIELKASTLMVSMKYALQASVEIPIYFWFHKILDRVEMMTLLLFCIVMSAIKFALYGFVSTPFLILLVSLLQIFTHPIIVILSKKMIQLCTPSQLLASSQMIGFAFYYGMSGFVAALLGQWLSKALSYDIALYVFSSISIFPIILWFFKRKYDKVKVVIKNENLLN